MRDNALLLEVIAGPDGIDSRQRDVQVARYTEGLDGGVAGLRIGVLKEGFGHPNSEPDVDAKVRAAAQRFAGLGAVVDEVSVPMHTLGFPIWAGLRSDSCAITFLETSGAGLGHEGLYLTGLGRVAARWRERADEFADTVKVACMFSKYTLGPLRRTLLCQGAEPAPAVARGLRRASCNRTISCCFRRCR